MADQTQSEASSRQGRSRSRKQAQRHDVPQSEGNMPDLQQPSSPFSQHQQALLKANIADKRNTKKLNLRSSIRLGHIDTETSQMAGIEPLGDKSRHGNPASQKLSLHNN